MRSLLFRLLALTFSGTRQGKGIGWKKFFQPLESGRKRRLAEYISINQIGDIFMSTSLLYHSQGIAGFQHVSYTYEGSKHMKSKRGHTPAIDFISSSISLNCNENIFPCFRNTYFDLSKIKPKAPKEEVSLFQISTFPIHPQNYGTSVIFPYSWQNELLKGFFQLRFWLSLSRFAKQIWHIPCPRQARSFFSESVPDSHWYVLS